MMEDYLEIRNAEGMPKLADQTIAIDFLLAAKTGVRNASISLSESTTPEVKAFFQAQLNNSLNMHEEISNFMLKKGWIHPFDVNEQFQVDTRSSEIASKIASLNLFPGDTSREGDFATPNK